MKQNKRYGLLFILIILIFTVSEALGYGANTNFKLEYLNSKLSLNVANVSLGSVLSKVQEKTGIKFLFDKEEAEKIISVSFQPLPIDKALKRILNNLSHLVFFDSNGKIKEVIIIGENKESLKSPGHRSNISSTSTNMISKPPGGEEMKITHGEEDMKITFSPYDMKITSPSSKTPPL